MAMTLNTAGSSRASSTGVSDDSLSAGALTASDIVFMVMAAAAPMAVVVALMPMAFGFGNGAGIPGTYLLAVAAIVLFAIGYVRIIPHVQNAGAFYAYIAASIGRVGGLSAAYVAAISYFALCCSTVATLAFFTEEVLNEFTGIRIHWSVWAFATIALVAVLSLHRITLTAKVLAIALIAEVAVILALDISIVWQLGLTRFDVSLFAPHTVLAPGLGIALIYAFNSMIGVEGTAIYQEEAINRRVTIPRATYISVIAVGLFYVFTAWCLVTAVGPESIGAIASKDPGLFLLNQSQTFLGSFGEKAIGLLVLTSTFAAVLAFFNNGTRYLYAMGRDGVMPKMFGHTHPHHKSPHVAGFTMTGGLVAVFASAVAADLHPMVNVATALVGLGSVGLMALMALTALAIPVFFFRRKTVAWSCTLAPAIGGLVIAIATVLACNNYSLLTGVNSWTINHLPYLLLVAAAAGAAQAMWLRTRRSDLYAQIGSTRVEERGNVSASSPQ